MLSLSLPSSDHLNRFGADLDGPAMGGDRGEEGEGESGKGRVASEHALGDSGRDWVGTTGASGDSSMATSPTESSTCGSGLKIS